ncbi:MAG: hypothetical protein OCC49_01515 [Fibrobacterales bacterium]
MTYSKTQIHHISLIFCTLICLGCTVTENAGTATATENTFAGVVLYPDDVPVEGAVVTLRKVGVSPIDSLHHSVQVDTTDRYGEYSFEFPDEKVVVEIAAIDGNSGNWGEIITLDPDAVDTTGIDTVTIETVLQMAVEVQVIIPDTIPIASVWVEGTGTVYTGSAGDTLVLPAVPQGDRMITIDYNGSTQTITKEVTSGTVVDFKNDSGQPLSQPSISSSSDELSSPKVSSSAVVSSSTIVSSSAVVSSSTIGSSNVHVSSSSTISSSMVSSSEALQSSSTIVPVIEVSIDTLAGVINDVPVIIPFLVTPNEYSDSVIITLGDETIASLAGAQVTALSFGTTMAYLEIPQLSIKDSVVIQVQSFLDSRPNTRGETQVYSMVKIGDQVWMKENMNVTTATGSSCYNDSLEHCDVYGTLYDWETAKEACTGDWLLPSFDDFDSLGATVSREYELGIRETNNWSDIAPLFMDITLGLWDVHFPINDSTQFSVLPAGFYNSHLNEYSRLLTSSYYWTDTEGRGGYGQYWYIGMNQLDLTDEKSKAFQWYEQPKAGRYSVRCILDIVQ